MITFIRSQTIVMEDSSSEGSQEGEGLKCALRIREGATGAVILEQDLVGECGSTQWSGVQREPRWGEWHELMLRALQSRGSGFVGYRGNYRKVTIDFLFIFIQKNIY